MMSSTVHCVRLQHDAQSSVCSMTASKGMHGRNMHTFIFAAESPAVLAASF